MSNGFEDAIHQGYSAADLAADMKERAIRCMDLGCNTCKYRDWNSVTCDQMIAGFLNFCPFYKEV